MFNAESDEDKEEDDEDGPLFKKQKIMSLILIYHIKFVLSPLER